MPALGLAEMKVKPPGNWSLTCTDSAVAGPALVTVSVNATGSYWTGALRSTLMVNARSAPTALNVTLAVLLAALGSDVVLATLALLPIDPKLTTRACTFSVALAPLARSPRFQMPLGAE